MFETESPTAGGPERYVSSPLLASAGLPHVFTTRHFPGITSPRDPGSPFAAAAMDLLADLGVASEPAAFLRQVHGADVVAADRGGLAGSADALLTSRRGLPLAIFTADCLPVVVLDPVNQRLAMVHAGWRGTALGASRAAAAALVAAGGAPETFVAAIGPSIGPCCYEVDGPVIAKLETGFPDRWQAWVASAAPGKWMLDLWRANEDQLEAVGIDRARIDNARLCTACRQDLFFSYRRGRGQGRLVAVAALPRDVSSPPAPAAGSH